MSKQLQNLFKIIEKNNNLSPDERESALKALKDADKELEIGAFKLERTQKVKKTTAILLEETIEELEQKRKSVEAQKRELEIEASLERVRTVAMSMNKTDELLRICEVSFNELKNLGFNNLRNSIIHIFYDDRKIFTDYDYSDFSGGEITNVDYKSHPVVENYLKQIKSAKDAFVEIEIGEKQLNDWKEFRKKIGDYDDPRLDNIKSLYYYFHSIGSGTIGISNFSQLTEDQVVILKRFRNVFDLAYHRYTDIKQAEAQTREAEIQLALERVRSRAMAMHKPEDISDTVNVFFKELKALGLVPIRCGVCEVHEKTRSWTAAITNATQQGDSYEIFGDVKQLGHTVLENMFKHWELQKEYYPVLKGAELKEYNQFLKTQLDVQDYHENTTHYGNYFYFKEGFVFAWTEVELSEEVLDIFRRSTSVLSLTYRRYMDLKEAEAQAREAQIEAALEKVRARTMAMQSSDELAETAYVLYQQFGLLGEGLEQLTIGIIDETQMVMEFWLTLGGNQVNRLFRAPIEEPIALKKSYLAWKEKKRSLVIDISGDELKAYYNFFKSLPDYKEYNEFRNSQSTEQRRVIHYAFFSKGFLALASNEPKPVETIQLLERFAGVFDGTYTRFFDLKNAEAQAREAQIEAALERVRSRSMAMHHTSELQDVINTVHQQFKILDIAITGGAFIAVNEENKNEIACWGAGGTADYVERVQIPFFNQPIYTRLIEGIQKGSEFFTEEFSYEEKIEFFNHLFKHPPYSDASPKRKKEVLSRQGGYTRSCAVSKYTSVFIINHHGRKFSEDENNILMRFGKVFEQTYTRFLDLKQAEEQAKEAQIEAALERVRSRTMGMQKSEELKEVIQVVYEQFVHLNIFIEHTGFIMDYKARDDMRIWLADQNGAPSQVTIPYFDSPHWNSFNDAKEKGLDLFTNKLNFEEKNRFYKKLFKFIPGLPEEAKKHYFSCPGLAISTVLLENVGLYIENFSGIPYSDEENNTLLRFGKVFQQTYTRFLDLQKAESQARESQIEVALERVRSKTMAMHNSQEVGATVVTLFDEVIKLGLDKSIRCGIGILEGTEGMETWSATSYPNGEVDLKMGLLDMTIHPMLIGLKKAWKIGEKSYSYDYSKNDLIKYYSALNNEPEYPFHIDLDTLPEQEFHNSFFFSEGILFAFTSNPISEEASKVLNRFASVFGQTYRRYLDLQNAEAQAREARIEAALERVRAKAMAMHSSEDLAITVDTFFSELNALDVTPHRCGVGIVDAETRTTDIHANATTHANEIKKVTGKLKLSGHPVLDSIFENWKVQKEYHPVLHGNEIIDYYKVMDPQIKFPDFADDETQYGYYFYFKEGGVFAWTNKELIERDLQIFRRYTSVLSLTYRRYMDLKEAEAQNKIIQAENERKTMELEEARQLQLAMLPKELPQLPNLDIAVHMQTATEVGGDYYDFQVGLDGTLTTIIGDATGHGMKAGTVVTITKSLFNSIAGGENILSTFDKISQVIKGMKFRQLAMCLIMMKIKGNRLSISSAAMPPILIYRAKSKTVEELLLEGMPLGTMMKFPYKKIESHLNSGDRILLYSDGLPELANNNDEMFGYNRIKTEFQSVGEKDPEKIVAHLKNSASQWADGKEPDDDVTFVVIKVK
jgi:hypothetical protein